MKELENMETKTSIYSINNFCCRLLLYSMCFVREENGCLSRKPKLSNYWWDCIPSTLHSREDRASNKYFRLHSVSCMHTHACLDVSGFCITKIILQVGVPYLCISARTASSTCIRSVLWLYVDNNSTSKSTRTLLFVWTIKIALDLKLNFRQMINVGG